MLIVDQIMSIFLRSKIFVLKECVALLAIYYREPLRISLGFLFSEGHSQDIG